MSPKNTSSSLDTTIGPLIGDLADVAVTRVGEQAVELEYLRVSIRNALHALELRRPEHATTILTDALRTKP